MNKLFGIAAVVAATLVAGGASAQPYGYGGGYTGGELPAPAYAYAGQGYGVPGHGGYDQAYDEGDCDDFTLAGAHAGVTVLGINAGAGAHLGVGGGACGRRHGHRIRFTPPPAPAYPLAPPPRAYAPPAPPPCGCEPPPPPPCNCGPGGW